MKLIWTTVSVITTLILMTHCTHSSEIETIEDAYLYGTFSKKTGMYIIGASDTLSIKVVAQNDLTGTYTVSPSGYISFPLIGYIKAEGFTQNNLSNKIRKKLNPFIKNPSVSLSVTAYNSYKVFVTGEVNAPGQYTYSKKTSILQGLIVAGGLTKFANGEITIVRKNKNEITKRYETNYYDILEGQNNLDQFLLQRGDVINVE